MKIHFVCRQIDRLYIVMTFEVTSLWTSHKLIYTNILSNSVECQDESKTITYHFRPSNNFPGDLPYTSTCNTRKCSKISNNLMKGLSATDSNSYFIYIYIFVNSGGYVDMLAQLINSRLGPNKSLFWNSNGSFVETRFQFSEVVR